MENTSTALIIASSMLIAMLIIGLMVYAFQSVSNFAQKQVTAEEVSEVVQFNQPYVELQARATHDFSGRDKNIAIGATAEDVLSIINHTNHVNASTPYRVEFILILDGKRVNANEFTPKKQQEFIQQDLEAKERDISNPRLKYECVLKYDETGVAPRVNYVEVRVKGRQ